jgi:hypothetical protein
MTIICVWGLFYLLVKAKQKVLTMFRQLISIRQMLVAFVILALNSGVALAQDETSKTYRCITKDAVSILQDGTLNKEVGKAALEVFDKIVIDVSNGHITYPSVGKREEWIVQKTSANDNDYVLFPSFSGRIDKKTVANAVTHFIRLRTATSDPQPRFMVFTLSYLVTGTCTIVR